jgi:dTMP kinase
MNKKPPFIVLCGGEGSGKSGALEAIKRKYIPNIIATREPGGSTYAEKIRDLMFTDPLSKSANAPTMFGLAWASRSEHMLRTVLPALKNGTPVICDRFDCCTYAYQVCAQQGGMILKDIFWNMREVFLAERTPDLYIFLDVVPEEGLRRRAADSGKSNHFDEQKVDFHNRVRDGYLSFLDEIEARGGKTVAIDANRSQEEVLKDVLMIVDALIQK